MPEWRRPTKLCPANTRPPCRCPIERHDIKACISFPAQTLRNPDWGITARRDARSAMCSGRQRGVRKVLCTHCDPNALSTNFRGFALQCAASMYSYVFLARRELRADAAHTIVTTRQLVAALPPCVSRGTDTCAPTHARAPTQGHMRTCVRAHTPARSLPRTHTCAHTHLGC